MTPVRIGLIGCGRIVQTVHLAILTKLPNARLVALAETDAQRRDEASQRAPDTIALASHEQLLRRDDIDAVVICLPTALHARIAHEALQHGKHVYVEKPLATSLAEARPVIDEWKRANVVGMMGFNYRFNKLHQAAQRALQRNTIGDIVSMRTVFTSAARNLPPWKQQRHSGGGVLLDLASHHIDLLHFLFGTTIDQVRADIHSQRTEDDTALVQFQLANGVAVQSFFSMCTTNEDRFEIYGTEGKLTIDRQRGWNANITSTRSNGSRFEQLRSGLTNVVLSPYLRQRLSAPTSEPSFSVALAHFASAIRDRQLPYPSFDDGYRSLAVVEAAEESARSGQTIRLKGERASR
ncbi:MAG: hypothetical protein GFH25_541276n24 [Chloroflexi bacterium AL-N10]|nr:hypothetical protein [Chloroflexi bacterium AL-N1]NOK71105.1 hypothetical protein [Chloroflexi bacterium AL-N10]NOK77353.1 hypothetical protein [Chloroflexi bacterium AL-N5]